MRFFREGSGPHTLEVSMAGLKIGERFLQVRCGNGKMFAAIATKVGLTGRACAVDDTADGCERGRKAAAKEGALVEVEQAPYDALPYEPGSFDVVVLWDFIGRLSPERRVRCLRQALAVLRPGGRGMVIERAPRGGLGALLGGPKTDERYKASGGAARALEAEGFMGVRHLAQRDGLAFVEGVRPAS